jgi:hypothetical protein
MLNQNEIENLINIDYDDFVRYLTKEIVEISHSKNLTSDVISISEGDIKNKLIEELRNLCLNKILDEK